MLERWLDILYDFAYFRRLMYLQPLAMAGLIPWTVKINPGHSNLEENISMHCIASLLAGLGCIAWLEETTINGFPMFPCRKKNSFCDLSSHIKPYQPYEAISSRQIPRKTTIFVGIQRYPTIHRWQRCLECQGSKLGAAGTLWELLRSSPPRVDECPGEHICVYYESMNIYK